MKITNIKIIILDNKTSQVKARATIEFDTHEIRGFKVFRDDKNGKDFVTAPSYFNGKTWIPLFKTINKKYWNTLCAKVIDKYNEELINMSLLEDK